MANISLAEAYETWADDLVRFTTVLVGPHGAPDLSRSPQPDDHDEITRPDGSTDLLRGDEFQVWTIAEPDAN